jgi:hypothetical protein
MVLQRVRTKTSSAPRLGSATDQSPISRLQDRLADGQTADALMKMAYQGEDMIGLR